MNSVRHGPIKPEAADSPPASRPRGLLPGAAASAAPERSRGSCTCLRAPAGARTPGPRTLSAPAPRGGRAPGAPGPGRSRSARAALICAGSAGAALPTQRGAARPRQVTAQPGPRLPGPGACGLRARPPGHLPCPCPRPREPSGPALPPTARPAGPPARRLSSHQRCPCLSRQNSLCLICPGASYHKLTRRAKQVRTALDDLKKYRSPLGHNDFA